MDNLLNPMLMKALGSLIRAGLMLAVPFFVSQGIWTPDEATATMTALATAAAALVWSLFEKYKSRQKLVTAIASAKGDTEANVEKKVDKGQAPPVTLQKDEVPHLVHTRRD
jgi:membrane protein implicated in regulation of membrane protease activity